jgi:hypothetical protein
MRFHHLKPFIAVFVAALFSVSHSFSQEQPHSPVLTRDIDKRPLPRVALESLSPRMRDAVKAVLNETKQDDRLEGVSEIIVPVIQRIPIAPRDHRLYLVQLSGVAACAPAGVNCVLVVFDETQSQVTEVVDGPLAEVIVIRRPNLQMPDIGAREQLGHFANHMTVYRFADNKWSPYACKETSIAGDDDPHPKILADASCAR